MRYKKISSILVLVCFSLVQPVYAFTDQGPVSYARAVKQAAPAVVSISTTKHIPLQTHPMFQDPVFQFFFGDQQQYQRQQPGLGSGVIVDQRGFILTNNHVIRNADEITVMLNDGRRFNAKIVGADSEADLAVLKVKAKNLPVITLGKIKEKQVGDVVLAIGNPFGVGQTVTQGIISALNRNHLGINLYENFIQTDAAINPGNSGGALIDAYGQLIGINTAIFSQSGGSQGIGFAIPIDLASNVMAQIIDTGHVERAWLGLSVQPLTKSLRRSFGFNGKHGVLVSSIFRDGPAHRGGIRPGDIITRIHDKIVTDAHDMLRYIANLKPGKTYKVEIFSNGKRKIVKVRFGKRPRR